MKPATKHSWYICTVELAAQNQNNPKLDKWFEKKVKFDVKES